MLLVFLVCNFAKIGHNMLNEVAVESFILADFANYHFNILSGKLNGPRKNNMHGVHMDLKRPEADDKEYRPFTLSYITRVHIQ